MLPMCIIIQLKLKLSTGLVINLSSYTLIQCRQQQIKGMCSTWTRGQTNQCSHSQPTVRLWQVCVLFDNNLQVYEVYLFVTSRTGPGYLHCLLAVWKVDINIISILKLLLKLSTWPKKYNSGVGIWTGLTVTFLPLITQWVEQLTKDSDGPGWLITIFPIILQHAWKFLYIYILYWFDFFQYLDYWNGHYFEISYGMM